MFDPYPLRDDPLPSAAMTPPEVPMDVMTRAELHEGLTLWLDLHGLDFDDLADLLEPRG